MSIDAPWTFVALRIDWNLVKGLSIAEVTEGLSAQRVARTTRLRQREDKFRCAFAGHLIDFLYRQTRPGQPPPALAEGPYGKPAFADPAAPAFNISHSGNWVVGISGHGPLGVDVQEIKSTTVVLNEVLSIAEIQAIEAMPAPLRARLFIQLWTLKEAHLKAQGLGLSVGLPAHLSFCIDDEGYAELADNTDPQVHRSILLDTHHACATCTPSPGPVQPTLIHATEILALRGAIK